ncbi:MAG: hypothetical protein RL701_5536 [Pseudomonadota bacterium]
MPNENGKAYGLTTLCPLINDSQNDQSYAAIIKGLLRNLPTDEASPLASVPNLYLCRLFVMDDVFYQGKPAAEDHLKNKYLVFIAEAHGSLDPFLEGLWHHAEKTIRELWQFCVAFHGVNSARDFTRYIRKCQVETTFYFNGSNDKPLAEQLKALYVKQELGKFARAHQGKPAPELQRAFKEFVARVEPFNLAQPTWRAGASNLKTAVVGS